MDQILFKEKQKPTVIPWIMISWVIINFLFVNYEVFITKELAPSNSSQNILLLLVDALMIYSLFVFIRTKLETKITETEIYYKLQGKRNREGSINWNEVKEVVVLKYNPIFKYYKEDRLKPPESGLSFTYAVLGNGRLQLILKNGERILIGTHKRKELEQVIELIQINKHIN